MRLLVLFLISQMALAELIVPNAFEQVPPGEAALVKGLNQHIKKTIRESRDAHAKAHGCVDGVKVTVALDPAVSGVGLFSKNGKTYDAIVRFSSGSGNPAVNDLEGGPQGFALKLLLGEEDQRSLIPPFGEDEFFVPEKYYRTFDVLTIAPGHEFMVKTVEDYPAFFSATAKAGAAAKAAVDKAAKDGIPAAEIPALAKAASHKVLLEEYIATPTVKRPREGKLLATLAQAKPKNVLQETYGSWVPSLWGSDKAVKYEIGPCEKGDPGAYVIPPEVGDWTRDPNFLSSVLRHELTQRDHCFELRIQSRSDQDPSVEDAAGEWSTSSSPYRKIAEIRIPKKVKGQQFIDPLLCEEMSFHPGHAPQAHYPVGGIQRARIGALDEDGDPYPGIYTVIHRERNLKRRNKN